MDWNFAGFMVRYDLKNRKQQASIGQAHGERQATGFFDIFSACLRRSYCNVPLKALGDH
jgi:hypothetical protein